MKSRIKQHLLKVLLVIAFLCLAFFQWIKEGKQNNKNTNSIEHLSDTPSAKLF